MSLITNSIKLKGGGSTLNYYEEYYYKTNFDFSYGGQAASGLDTYITRIGNTVYLFMKGVISSITINTGGCYFISNSGTRIPAKFLAKNYKIYNGIVYINNTGIGTPNVIARIYVSSDNGLITIQPDSATNFNAGSFSTQMFIMSWIIEN